MKYAWIDAHRNNYGVDGMGAVLDVNESGYRSLRGEKPSRGKRLTDAQMLALIQVSMLNSKAPTAARA